MDYLRADSILSDILEERKSLAGFLDAIFGFLSRKTDFYHVQRNKDENFGFPRGIKEDIIISCMQKYEKDHEPIRAQTLTPAPPAIEEVEIETDFSIPAMEPVNDVDMVGISKIQETPKSPTRVMNFRENDYTNGAIMDKYCWSQTLKDVELSVILPDEVKSGKHVKLNLTSNYISIKSLLPQEESLVSGETWAKYRHNDVVWTISDGKLILSFDKSKECWWDKLLVQEQSIDIKKLNTDRPIEEFTEETQRAIEKMQTEEMTNKELGDLKTLPLSKSEQLSRLKQAWNADNSPFKGKPFDPSVIQFS